MCDLFLFYKYKIFLKISKICDKLFKCELLSGLIILNENFFFLCKYLIQLKISKIRYFLPLNVKKNFLCRYFLNVGFSPLWIDHYFTENWQNLQQTAEKWTFLMTDTFEYATFLHKYIVILPKIGEIHN